MTELTKTITIDGMTFQITKLNALPAMQLEKHIMGLLAPIVASLMEIGKNGLDAKVDFSIIGQAFTQAVGTISDDEYQKIILDSLKNVVYLESGKPAQQMDENLFNNVFMGKLLVVYKLIFEIMKFNRFCFFELVEGGWLTEIINSSKNSEKKTKT